MVNNIVGIVPMRHSSERIPGKNYRDFAGKPMYQHILIALHDSKVFDKIIVDTDSPIIQQQCSVDFPEVIVLERPAHLIDGSIPMNDVLLNIVNTIPSKFYFQTHSTNPLLSAKTIGAGVQKFLEKYPMHDSLFSVTKRNVRYWNVLAQAINHNPNILLRTQDLPPIFEENSCMYIFTKEILESKHNRIGDRPFMFEMPEIESQDIDVELNFLVAEFLYKTINNTQS